MYLCVANKLKLEPSMLTRHTAQWIQTPMIMQPFSHWGVKVDQFRKVFSISKQASKRRFETLLHQLCTTLVSSREMMCMESNCILQRYLKTSNSTDCFSTCFAMSSSWVVSIRVIQSCHLLVCLFIYRHFTAKLAISEYDR